VLNNGMSILGLGTDYQQLIKGLVLLLAVGFDIFNKNRSGGGSSIAKRFKWKTAPSDSAEEPKPAAKTPVAVAAAAKPAGAEPVGAEPVGAVENP
jgi:putative multiple sugar transport system permease protein